MLQHGFHGAHGETHNAVALKSHFSRKNSLIELFRFLFASIVILGHARLDFKFRLYLILPRGGVTIPLFPKSYFGVEFFFLVSG